MQGNQEEKSVSIKSNESTKETFVYKSVGSFSLCVGAISVGL